VHNIILNIYYYRTLTLGTYPVLTKQDETRLPFEIKYDEWLTIENYMKVSAYCDKTTIYTILKFPIVAQPMYDILNVISSPTYNYVNKFAYRKVDNKLIAINKDMRIYVILTKQN